MEIGIVGAGIGGLVAALGLQRDGHGVAVFERAHQPGAIGAGLSLFGNSFAALDAVGLGGVVRPLTGGDASLFRAGQRDPSGRWLTILPPAAVALLRVVHRAELHRGLLTALRPGTLRPGTEASVAPDGSPVLTVAGNRLHFDLVIAADGINSRARAALGLDPGLRYSGYTAWRGVTRGPVKLNGDAGETWGRGCRFGIVPLPDGRVYWFATQNLPPETVFVDGRAELLKSFGDWHAPIRELLEDTDPEALLRHDVSDLARPLESFVRRRTILLGDAAHAMTPDLGQGAGQAIEDAAAITLLLRESMNGGGCGAAGPDTGNPDAASPGAAALDAAVRAYDSSRRPRSQRIARRSRVAGQVGQWEQPVAVAVRDAVLRAIPGRLAGEAALRVQQWEGPAASTRGRPVF